VTRAEIMSALPPVKKYVSSTGVRIYRIPCQVFDSLSARVYLLLGAGPPTLLDAGSGIGPSTRQILDGVDAVRGEFGEPIHFRDVRRIIVSHGHVDHIGGLAELRAQASKAQVAVHPLELGVVASYREHVALVDERLHGFFRLAGVDPSRRRKLLSDLRFGARAIESVEADVLLEDGQLWDGLRVIHTPGHAPGHLCIGVGNVLLSFDHILARTVPQQWPECTAPFTGLAHYLESLDKVKNLPGFDLALGAHEQAIHDVYGRIEAIRASHRRRLERLHDMLSRAGGPLTIDEITNRLYSEVTGFRAVLAITDVGSRVEYLHQRGLLKVLNVDELERQEGAAHRYGVA